MKSRNLKAMLLGVAFAASLTFAGTQPQMPFAPLLEVHAAAYQDVELDSKLKEAVFDRNFILYYQPQYYAGNQKLRGMEALIRWKDGDGKMISPAKFIPIAEKNGTIIPIGNWVLEQSIRTFSEWRNRYGVPFVLSVNISALQYQKEDFVDSLLHIIYSQI